MICERCGGECSAGWKYCGGCKKVVRQELRSCGYLGTGYNHGEGMSRICESRDRPALSPNAQGGCAEGTGRK